MTSWVARRFWDTTGVVADGVGYGVTLDARRLRTPAKGALVVPTRALAQAIADEWQAQEKTVVPDSMPLTRMANSAIDKVGPQHRDVALMLAGYGATDLLCYRADGPEELVRAQRQAWDPLLAWMAQRGASLQVTHGITPVSQPEAALDAMTQQVLALDPWRLTAFHDFVTISGSLVVGLAMAHDVLSAERAWPLSRIEEDWQIRQWGADEEAQAYAQARRAALLDAARFWALLHQE